MLYDRHEDVQSTTKRHPAQMKIRAGAKKGGELTALEIDIVMDGGAYATLTQVVLSRGVIHAAGPYRCPNTTITGRSVTTHTVPNGAFRGFGAPQTCFGIEMHMNRLAEALGIDPMEFRKRNLLKIGDTTATGQVLAESVSTEAVVAETERLCDYAGLRKKAAAFNRKKSPLKYGVGVATFYHGAGFTGSGEVYLASRAAVELTEEGRVRVLASSTEIGQGAQTIFSQFAGQALGVPSEEIEVAPADTSIVPDSGPTVASRTTMVVGGLVYDAARQLREKIEASVGNGWKSAEAFRKKARAFAKANGRTVCTSAYRQPPGIAWDEETYTGSAYACFGWAAAVVEVLVDTRTLEARLMRVTTAQDVGRAVHPILCAGQVEGGTLQALGWGLLEEVDFSGGEFRNANFTNYIIPTSLDTPPMQVALIENPTKYGPLGAKGIGEMPMDGPAGAVVAAIADATGIWVDRIPATPERLLAAKEAVGAGEAAAVSAAEGKAMICQPTATKAATKSPAAKSSRRKP
jgi:CO/xanthine dehydrogenase Mo-binding subunit